MNLYQDTIASGQIDVAGKSELDIKRECAKLLYPRMLNIVSGKTEFSYRIDHRTSILTEAREYKKTENYELSCVLYAIWVEHWVNHLIQNLCLKKGLTEKEAAQIIRQSNFNSKITWLLKILEGKFLYTAHRKNIEDLIEFRNSFIHYKFNSLIDDKLKESDNKLKIIINSFEKTVKYLINYENKHIYLKTKRKIKPQNSV